MSFDRFELAVIELANRGVRLTVANVAAQLHVAPKKAEKWLDDMAREGRLDLELDEVVGLVFYRVRGLTPAPTSIALRPASIPPVVHRGHKSPVAAAMLGLLLPGAGLLYAAPASVAAIAGLVTLVAITMTGALPVIGGLLSSITLGLCALLSGALGVMYVKQYNRHGRRTHLAPAAQQAALRQAQQAASTFAWRT
jgi:hypothetical protein